MVFKIRTSKKTQEFFEAIEARNAELAEKHTTEHIANAANHILKK